MLHIHRPSDQRYIVRLRELGRRRWVVIGRRYRSQDTAVAVMARHFLAGCFKRGQVLVVANYYDPHVVVEMTKR